MGGDFNSIGDSRDAKTVTSALEEYIKVESDFLEETSMTDCWRVFNPDTIRFTRFSQNPKRLDKFWASSLLLNYLSSAEIGIAYKTDHSPIYVTFIMNRNPKGKGFFRFPDFLTQDKEYGKILSHTVEKAVQQNFDQITPEQRPLRRLLLDTVISSIRGQTIEYLTWKKKRNTTITDLNKDLSDLVSQRDLMLSMDEDVGQIEREILRKEDNLERVSKSKRV